MVPRELNIQSNVLTLFKMTKYHCHEHNTSQRNKLNLVLYDRYLKDVISFIKTRIHWM